jgi:hypothetical protein
VKIRLLGESIFRAPASTQDWPETRKPREILREQASANKKIRGAQFDEPEGY